MTQNVQTTLEAIQLLKLLPESERTEHYDAVVAPLIEEAAASVVAQDPDSVALWFQIQSAAFDWAVEGITEVTHNLQQSVPGVVEHALTQLQPEQRIRVTQLLNELEGGDNLPPAVAERAASLAASMAAAAADAASRPPSETRIFAEFVGASTFTSSRGFPVFRGTMKIFTPDGGVAASFDCNNGGGARNFTMRNGPLPPGVYRVSNHRANRTTPGMRHQGVGYSFDLDPTDGTQVFGRSLFRIHPDADPLGTNGCIGVREDAAQLRDCERRIARLVDEHNGAFKITVRF